MNEKTCRTRHNTVNVISYLNDRIYFTHSNNIQKPTGNKREYELTVILICNIKICVLSSRYPADICKAVTDSWANIQQHWWDWWRNERRREKERNGEEGLVKDRGGQSYHGVVGSVVIMWWRMLLFTLYERVQHALLLSNTIVRKHQLDLTGRGIRWRSKWKHRWSLQN